MPKSDIQLILSNDDEFYRRIKSPLDFLGIALTFSTGTENFDNLLKVILNDSKKFKVAVTNQYALSNINTKLPYLAKKIAEKIADDDTEYNRIFSSSNTTPAYDIIDFIKQFPSERKKIIEKFLSKPFEWPKLFGHNSHLLAFIKAVPEVSERLFNWFFNDRKQYTQLASGHYDFMEILINFPKHQEEIMQRLLSADDDLFMKIAYDVHDLKKLIKYFPKARGGFFSCLSDSPKNKWPEKILEKFKQCAKKILLDPGLFNQWVYSTDTLHFLQTTCPDIKIIQGNNLDVIRQNIKEHYLRRKHEALESRVDFFARNSTYLIGEKRLAVRNATDITREIKACLLPKTTTIFSSIDIDFKAIDFRIIAFPKTRNKGKEGNISINISIPRNLYDEIIRKLEANPHILRINDMNTAAGEAIKFGTLLPSMVFS